MKFSYGHFPNGTVVTVNLAGENWGGSPSSTSCHQLTVESLGKNGPRSYVFKSGDSIINIDFVTSIVLRGPENALQMKYTPFQATLKDVISGVHQTKKGFHLTHNPARLLEWELGKVLHHFEEVDVSKMTSALIKQGFVAIEGLGRWPVRKINKKRFRKWVKQNARRFLLNLDAEEKGKQRKKRQHRTLVSVGNIRTKGSQMSSVYTKPGARTIIALHTSTKLPPETGGTSIRKLVFPDLEEIDGNLWLRANYHEPSEFPKLREVAASGTGTIKRDFYNDVPCVPWPETLHQTLRKLRKTEGRIVAYTIRSPVFLTVNNTILHANWLDEVPLTYFDETSDTAAGRGDCLETHQMNYILTKLGCKLGDRFKRETEFFEENLQTVKHLMANKPQ